MRNWVDDFKDKLIEDRRPLPEGDFEILMGKIYHHNRQKTRRLLIGTLLGGAFVCATIFYVLPHESEEFVIVNESLEKEQKEQLMVEDVTETLHHTRPHEIKMYEYPTVQKKETRIALNDEFSDDEDTSEEERAVLDVNSDQSTIHYDNTNDFLSNNKFLNERKKRERFSVKLSFGGISGDNSSYGNLNIADGASVPGYQEAFRFSHNTPRVYGLSISYLLNERLRIVSGLDYYYCYSKVSPIMNDKITYNQYSHYLGIPFHLDWMPLKGNTVSFYIGAGCEAYKCIFATFNGETLKDGRVYFSAIGLAGVEYMPTNTLGVFLEPQYSYSLFRGNTNNEGHQSERIHTPITDGPNILSLRAGVRFLFE